MLSGCVNTKSTLNLVPWPKSVEVNRGVLILNQDSRIVAEDPILLPLAKVLSDEVYLASALRLEALAGFGRPGDIVLTMSADRNIESYTLDINEMAVIQGGSYDAVALGTVTLLQAIISEGGKVTLPRMVIVDDPDVEYRGLMIDTARNFRPIESLKQCVMLCRLYKIK